MGIFGSSTDRGWAFKEQKGATRAIALSPVTTDVALDNTAPEPSLMPLRPTANGSRITYRLIRAAGGRALERAAAGVVRRVCAETLLAAVRQRVRPARPVSIPLDI